MSDIIDNSGEHKPIDGGAAAGLIRAKAQSPAQFRAAVARHLAQGASLRDIFDAMAAAPGLSDPLGRGVPR